MRAPPQDYRGAQVCHLKFPERVFPIGLPQLDFEDLTACIAGEFRHEVNGSGAFVAGQVLAAEFDDVAGRDVGGGHHDRLHGLAPVVVGDTDDRGVGDGGLLDQHAFHLGSVVLATGDDHVLEPVLDVDVTVGV
jgi:hypothetical protein